MPAELLARAIEVLHHLLLLAAPLGELDAALDDLDQALAQRHQDESDPYALAETYLSRAVVHTLNGDLALAHEDVARQSNLASGDSRADSRGSLNRPGNVGGSSP